MPPAPYPGSSGPWRPPPALSSSELYPGYFLCFFAFAIYRECYGFGWAFFTHRRFYLMLLPHIFVTTCCYQGLHWSCQFFLEVCKASCWSSKYRTGQSLCLIHSNPQSWHPEKLFFKPYQILSWITCGKKFSLFSSLLVLNFFRLFKVIYKSCKKHFEQDFYCL